jgi:acetoin utilization deacetylase AcuC-like enzyme
MLKIAWHNCYKHPLKENHRFPMVKYELIPLQLIRENICQEENFFTPSPISEQDVLSTHTKAYYNKLCALELTKKEARPIGFPLSDALVQREKIIVQGTLQGAVNALKNNVSLNIAGGTHHAFSNKAEAFCLLNDQAIAANYLLKNKMAKKILIIDLDVHQGNGTAEIFSNNSDVFTLSFHGKNNYPFKKEISDLDVEFEDGTADDTYLTKLSQILPKTIKMVQPDFIFYLAGVDVIKNDKLGKLALSIEGCKKRDEMVFKQCIKNNLPVQVSMGGGYSSALKEIVDAHLNTFRLANELFF